MPIKFYLSMHWGLILSVLSAHISQQQQQRNGNDNNHDDDDETLMVADTPASILRPLTSMMRKCTIN